MNIHFIDASTDLDALLYANESADEKLLRLGDDWLADSRNDLNEPAAWAVVSGHQHGSMRQSCAFYDMVKSGELLTARNEWTDLGRAVQFALWVRYPYMCPRSQRARVAPLAEAC